MMPRILFALFVVHFFVFVPRGGAEEFPDYRPVAGWPQLPPKVKLGPVSAVATDAKDRVYVAHRGPQPILVFKRDGKFLRSWGDDHIKTVHGLRINSAGNVWITDIGNHLVMKFDAEGKLLLSLGRKDMRVPNSRSSTGRPMSRSHRRETSTFQTVMAMCGVLKFDRTGKLLKHWGTKGKGDGEFNLPHAICIDAKGRVYVGDREETIGCRSSTAMGQFS